MDNKISSQEVTTSGLGKKDFLAAVYGLGRTGLPVALALAIAGIPVIGIEANKDIVDSLKEGRAPFNEEGMEEALNQVINKKFFPEHNDTVSQITWDRVTHILIHVGLSLSDIRRKNTVITQVIKHLLGLNFAGKVIIFRTTVPIGFTRKVSAILEKRSKLDQGKDFHVVYVPERLWEGRAIKDTTTLPHLIGPLSDEGYRLSEPLFSQLGGRTLRVSMPEVAEMIKLAENSWRDTTFAFANDLAMTCDKLGINAYEVLKAANSDYEWNNIPLPGPVSGYCLRKDPMILGESEGPEGKTRLWVRGRFTNEKLLRVVAKRVTKSKIKTAIVMGLSFKADIDDFRDSHSLVLIELLNKSGKKVYGFDPFINQNVYTKIDNLSYSRIFKDIKTLENRIPNAAVIISTPHWILKSEKFVSTLLLQKPKLIVDLWGVLISHKEKFEANSIEYACLGSGRFWR